MSHSHIAKLEEFRVDCIDPDSSENVSLGVNKDTMSVSKDGKEKLNISGELCELKGSWSFEKSPNIPAGTEDTQAVNKNQVRQLISESGILDASLLDEHNKSAVSHEDIRKLIADEVGRAVAAEQELQTGKVDVGCTLLGKSIEVGDYSERSIAVGSNSSSLSRNTLALGNNVHAQGENSITVGVGSTSSGDYSIAIGGGIEATGEKSIAIGYNITQSWDGSISLGDYAGAKVNGIALGQNADAGKSSVSIADSAKTGENSVAVGFASKAQATQSTSVGSSSTASGISSIAVGSSSVASGALATAVGNSAKAKSTESTALGYSSTAEGTYAIAVGCSSNAGDCSIAVGQSATASADFSTAIGFNAYNDLSGSFLLKSFSAKDTATLCVRFVAGADADTSYFDFYHNSLSSGVISGRRISASNFFAMLDAHGATTEIPNTSEG